MKSGLRRQGVRGVILLATALAGVGCGILFLGAAPQPDSILLRRPTGEAQFIGFQPFPATEGQQCEWVPASAVQDENLIAALQLRRQPERDQAPTPQQLEEVRSRKPLRMIKDHYSAYSSVAVDIKNNEVVMTDESLFNILTYSRTENTPPHAALSEPKRIIGGLNTFVEYQCALYIDQNTGDIYAVNNDTVDRLVIFSRNAKGNVPPDRILHTPHTTYGIAVDEEHQEMFFTVQEAAAVSVFQKHAKDHDPPIRLIQGDQTGLGDPHGIAVDSQRGLLFVANFGSLSDHDAAAAPKGPSGERYQSLSEKPNWPLARESSVPGSGKFVGASITVYPRDAAGNVDPIRVIQGPNTQLNWPTALALDPRSGDLFVANDAGDSVLVFGKEASGDAAPIRVIKGPKSLVKSPTGIFFDNKNNELWVSNFGNHTATVYHPAANGDVPPLRVIRSAPLDKPTPNIANAFAAAYDSKRDEILVPN